MKVIANVERTDLLRLNLYMLPRMKSNWIVVFVVAGFVTIWLLVDSEAPLDAVRMVAALITGLTASLIGFGAGIALCMTFMLLSSSVKAGILGEHEFEIRADGLFEKTAANEQLNKWSGISSVHKTGAFIYVKISSYLFHIIPRRSFPTSSDYDAFFEDLNTRWRTAAV